MIKNVYWSSFKSTHYSCPILMKVEFSRQIFEKNIHISNAMKIRPEGAEFLHGNGRTDGQTRRS